MSMTTPPGWYPDPASPPAERWWDGTSWTGHTRPPGGGVVVTAASAPGPARGRRGLLPLAAAGVVLVAAIAAGVALTGRDDPQDQARPSRSAVPAPAPTGQDSSSEPPATAPAGNPSVLVDQLNGITLPVPDGWERPENTVEDDPTIWTKDIYTCPIGSFFCHHGTVTTHAPEPDDATSAEALARQDISRAADTAYEANGVGSRRYGGITSHEQIAARPAVVAGRTGYLVRWRVSTGKGPGGYVQSLAFPSTAGTGALVIVRFAFDAGPDGPALSGMDTITAGIRPIGDVSGGVGSSIGP